MGSMKNLVQRGMSLPAAVLAMLLIASGLSLYWSIGTLKAVSVEKNDLAGDLSRLTQLQTTIVRGEEVLADLENSMSSLKRNVPASMDFQPFYSELTSLTRRHAIDVSKIEPKEMEQTPEYNLMAITVNGESSFVDFFKFTRDLSAAQRLVTFERMDVRGLLDGKRCTFEIMMNIYSMDKAGEGDV